MVRSDRANQELKHRNTSVNRSESLRSEKSDKKVSFNKSIGVKHIPKGTNRASKPSGGTSRGSSGSSRPPRHSSNPSEASEWVGYCDVSKEPVTSDSEQLLQEAEGLLKVVDSVSCGRYKSQDSDRPHRSDRVKSSSYTNQNLQEEDRLRKSYPNSYHSYQVPDSEEEDRPKNQPNSYQGYQFSEGDEISRPRNTPVNVSHYQDDSDFERRRRQGSSHRSYHTPEPDQDRSKIRPRHHTSYQNIQDSDVDRPKRQPIRYSSQQHIQANPEVIHKSRGAETRHTPVSNSYRSLDRPRKSRGEPVESYRTYNQTGESPEPEEPVYNNGTFLRNEGGRSFQIGPVVEDSFNSHSIDRLGRDRLQATHVTLHPQEDQGFVYNYYNPGSNGGSGVVSGGDNNHSSIDRRHTDSEGVNHSRYQTSPSEVPYNNSRNNSGSSGRREGTRYKNNHYFYHNQLATTLPADTSLYNRRKKNNNIADNQHSNQHLRGKGFHQSADDIANSGSYHNNQNRSAYKSVPNLLDYNNSTNIEDNNQHYPNHERDPNYQNYYNSEKLPPSNMSYHNPTKVERMIHRFNQDHTGGGMENQNYHQHSTISTTIRGPVEPDTYNNHNQNRPFSYTSSNRIVNMEAVRKLSPSPEFETRRFSNDYSAKIIIREDYNDDDNDNDDDDDAYESYQIPQANDHFKILTEKTVKHSNSNNMNMSSIGVQTDENRNRTKNRTPNQRTRSANKNDYAPNRSRTEPEYRNRTQPNYRNEPQGRDTRDGRTPKYGSNRIQNDLASATLVRNINRGFGRTDRSPSPPQQYARASKSRSNARGKPVVPLLSDTSDAEYEVRRTVDPLAKIRKQVLGRERLNEESDIETSPHLRSVYTAQLTPLTIDDMEHLSLTVDNEKGNNAIVVSNTEPRSDFSTQLTSSSSRVTSSHVREERSKHHYIRSSSPSEKRERPYTPDIPREQPQEEEEEEEEEKRGPQEEEEEEEEVVVVEDDKKKKKEKKKKKKIKIKFFYDAKDDNEGEDPLAKYEEFKGTNYEEEEEVEKKKKKETEKKTITTTTTTATTTTTTTTPPTASTERELAEEEEEEEVEEEEEEELDEDKKKKKKEDKKKKKSTKKQKKKAKKPKNNNNNTWSWRSLLRKKGAKKQEQPSSASDVNKPTPPSPPAAAADDDNNKPTPPSPPPAAHVNKATPPPQPFLSFPPPPPSVSSIASSRPRVRGGKIRKGRTSTPTPTNTSSLSRSRENRERDRARRQNHQSHDTRFSTLQPSSRSGGGGGGGGGGSVDRRPRKAKPPQQHPQQAAPQEPLKARYFGDTDLENEPPSTTPSKQLPQYAGDYRSLPTRVNKKNARNRNSHLGRGRSPASSRNSSESEVDSRASHVSTSSNRSVYLHATAVADIPVRRQTDRQSDRQTDRHSDRQTDRQTRKVSRSFSLLAPWKPRHYREKFEVDYDKKTALPPRPPRRPPPSTTTASTHPPSQGGGGGGGKGGKLSTWLRRKRNKDVKGI